MATINYDSGRVITLPSTETTAGPSGAAASKPIYAANASKRLKVITGTFVGDSSYPTGGEDISDLFNQFSGTPAVLIDSKIQTADTGKLAQIDYTNKKLKLMTAFDTELGSGVTWVNTTIRFVAVGV
jgi:hypothetical protein